MSKKTMKLIGSSISDFESLQHGENKEVILQPARLIPFYKPGDEMALTSVFLSALRLINEFRSQIFQTINLRKSNQMMFFTEVEFALFGRKRVDGLILVVRGQKIIDAVLLEIKNKNTDLNEEQIHNYLEISKAYGIPKLLTISNQFVSFPTQSPLNLKVPKQVGCYHLSWSFILTVAHILLAKNDNNIADADQVEIMREVVEYFESVKSGILGFTQMKPGWVEVTQKANAGTSFKISDSFVEEAISSWLQEERDMALILSRKLGLLVRSGKPKFKNDLCARINCEKKELVATKCLESTLQIDGAASPLNIRACFERKNIEMSSMLSPPQDKKVRGQLTWILNQLRKCEKKNAELFSAIKNDLIVEIHLKFVRDPIRVHINEFDSAVDQIGVRQIKGFSILLLKVLGRKFESRKGVIETIEHMLIDYYQGILQHLKKWEKPAPKITKNPEQDESI